MKGFKIKYSTLAFLMCVSVLAYSKPMSHNAPADSMCSGEFVRDYSATYNLNDNGAVFLINKHGKIKVVPTNDNVVTIKVHVIANTNSQTQADKTFSRIHIQFSNSDTYVKGETVIDDMKSGGWFQSYNNKNDYTIDYYVSMPKNCNLDVTHKYGDAHIGTLNNYVKIDQRYGNFKLEGAKYANIYLAYGEGTLGEVGGIKGEISYSHLNAPDIKDVQLKSKYSEFHINNSQTAIIESAYDDYFWGDAKFMTINSRYGDFTMGDVGEMKVISSYTDYKVRNILNAGNFNMNYGDLVIQNLKSGFNALELTGNYTDVKVDVLDDTPFTCDVSSNYSDVSLPKGIVKKVWIEKGSHQTIQCYNGKETTKGNIKVWLNYGSLQIKEVFR